MTRARVVPLGSGLVLALAAYVSGATLDQLVLPHGVIRAALLPSWPTLAAASAAVAIAVLLAIRSEPARRALPVALGAGVLLLPYLPFVADFFPPLQLPAGPLLPVIWFTVACLWAWAAWQHGVFTDWRVTLPSPPVCLAALVTLSVAAGAAGAIRFTRAGIMPSGDEPHYLVVAQSLWRDGDLAIGNNHARGDYLEYFPLQLDPHAVTRGVDGEIYSIHPVGLPVLMAPVYAAGGYWAVIAALLVAAAAATAVMWRSIATRTGSPGAASFAWMAVALTTPFFFNSFAIHPEVLAALAAAAAFVCAVHDRATPVRRLVVGLACAALPWLSTKYAPMSAALVAVALLRIWDARTARAAGVLLVIVPYVLSIAAWLTFFYVIWGSPLPSAPYVDTRQMQLRFLASGAPGLLLDQEYGLLAYAPVYVLALTGLARMWRSDRGRRRLAAEVTVVFGALLLTVGAYQIWWGGAASPSRPVTSGLPLLMLPIAEAVRAASSGSARQAGQQLLLWLSVGLCALLLVAQHGFILLNARDGTSTLLEYLSPRWEAWHAAPSFGAREPLVALRAAAVWLAIAAVASVALRRVRVAGASGAALLAIGALVLALSLAAAIVPLVAGPELRPLDLRARTRLPLLDHFDERIRPFGIRFDPLRVVAARNVLSSAAFELNPGQQRDPQPIPLFGNARYELPAGRYRITAEWIHDAAPTSVDLQVGRFGSPWHQWTVTPSPTAPWQAEVHLPIDANFVGFRLPPDAAAALSSMTLQPLQVVGRTVRPRTPLVNAAAHFAAADVFFHDQNYFEDAESFWTRGERSVRLTIAASDPERPLMLEISSGPVANRVALTAREWAVSRDLQAGIAETIELPATSAPITLTIATAGGFRPSEVDPSSSDRRWLGVLIRVR